MAADSCTAACWRISLVDDQYHVMTAADQHDRSHSNVTKARGAHPTAVATNRCSCKDVVFTNVSCLHETLTCRKRARIPASPCPRCPCHRSIARSLTLPFCPSMARGVGPPLQGASPAVDATALRILDPAIHFGLVFKRLNKRVLLGGT
jgi:hypothetical protein